MDDIWEQAEDSFTFWDEEDHCYKYRGTKWEARRLIRDAANTALVNKVLPNLDSIEYLKANYKQEIDNELIKRRLKNGS